jgi:hypothetical protein
MNKETRPGEAEKCEPLDEGQQRMMDAAAVMMALPEVYAKIHEFDDACQPGRLRK